MGFSSILGAIAFMFVFAGMAVFAVTMQKNLTAHAQEQALAAEREREQGTSGLTVTAATYATNAIVSWTDTTYADFAAGSSAGVTITGPGTLVLVGPAYVANGTWTSPVIDTGVAGANYSAIAWTAVLPSGTDVGFQVRSAASPAALAAAPFTGPSGTGADRYTASGTPLNDSATDGNRYLQYRAYLGTTDTGNTPQLQEVALGVQRFTGVATVTVRNSGSVGLEHAQTDLYLAGVRVPRNATNRTVDLGATTDQVLWQPGESVTFRVFGTRTVPTAVTVANGPARGAGTVS
jgi:archaellum component FlaF (FlaF/FlaG flagellin family)